MIGTITHNNDAPRLPIHDAGQHYIKINLIIL